ncbi:hypothetical protein RRG08_028655 [Elysia crispata]|uniref:Uncharacterized protein n=1 Tax=Elysia crispata TaxID=231223 RepID=A0AAE0ZBW3_9GAST|nr:hypothetical protein RRG08_028655 [Elysia crispata]
MDMDGVDVYELETIGLEVEVTTTYELDGEILESLPQEIEISEEVQEEMEHEANVLAEHTVQDFIQNSPLLRDGHYVVTEESHEFMSGSEESSEQEEEEEEEEEDESDESPLSPSESDTEHSGESDQDSDDMEAEEVRGQAAGPRVIVLPANFYIQYITLYGSMYDSELDSQTLCDIVALHVTRKDGVSTYSLTQAHCVKLGLYMLHVKMEFLPTARLTHTL